MKNLAQFMERRTILKTGVGLAVATSLFLGTVQAQEGVESPEFKVTFIQPSTSLSFGPYFAALALGTFEARGIEYEAMNVAAPNLVAALLSGEGDIGPTGAATAIDAIERGARLTIVGSTAVTMSVLGLNKDVAARLAAEGITQESPIEERVQALRGLRLGTTAEGSANMLALRATLLEYGVDANDLTLLPTDASAMIAGLRQGALDGAMYGIGVIEHNYADGSAIPWIDWPAGDVPSLKEATFGAIVARSDVVSENPDLIEAFVGGLADAGEIIRTDPDRARDALREKFFPQVDEEIWALSWEIAKPAFILDGTMPRPAFDRTIDLLTSVGGRTYTNISYDEDVADIAKRDD